MHVERQVEVRLPTGQVGRKSRKRNNNPPAITKRTPASMKGGNPSNPIRIARYVEPQIKYNANMASATPQRLPEVAASVVEVEMFDLAASPAFVISGFAFTSSSSVTIIIAANLA